MRSSHKILAGLLSLALLGEIGLRFSGVGDFPVYQTDSGIGYIPSPNQSGKFLRKNDWIFNDKSMGTDLSFQPSEKNDILLLGDSLVHGGNPYRQSEKLGSQLQKRLDKEWQVWPVGAPSWGFLNEKEYLHRNTDVVSGIDGLVWIFNSGDFQDLSPWWTDATHPRSKPLYLSYYVLNKYGLEGNLNLRFPKFLFWVKSPPPVSQKPLDGEFDTFVNEIQALKSPSLRRKVVVLYPDKNETVNKSDDFYESLATRLRPQLEEEGWSFINLRENPDWNGKFYRDFIHPTPAGNQFLAEKIAEVLEKQN